MVRSGARRFIRRHAAFVRVTHWVNVLCLAVLLMSGLQIFNAHPALYWGSISHFDHPFVAMTAMEDGAGDVKGLTFVAGHAFDTTGVLGASAGPDGDIEPRGFPAWITLPSYQDLATGRRWHFFFAWFFVLNGLVYLLYGLFSNHFGRDLVPTRKDLRHIGASVWDHVRLRFPHGEEARRYNVLQKLAYLAVIFGLLPLMIATGLTMSPGFDAIEPGLLTFFGGRQSARTIHFLTASGILLFVAVHIAMVLVSGVWNNLRSMITGRYAIDVPGEPHDRA